MSEVAPNGLEQLKVLSNIVAESSHIEALLTRFSLQASSTPALALHCANSGLYPEFFAQARHCPGAPEQRLDRLQVLLAELLLQTIPGRVSFLIDPRTAFSTRAIIERVRRVLTLFEHDGTLTARVIFKIVATWEGVRAVRVLELEGIRTNLTLVACPQQALAAAAANASMINPLAAPINEWYALHQPVGLEQTGGDSSCDPGVQCIVQVLRLLKSLQAKTEVVAGGLHSLSQVLALAGCDYVALPPELADQLVAFEGIVEPLRIGTKQTPDAVPSLNETEFRNALTDSCMAIDTLTQGIRRLSHEAALIEAMLR